MRSLKKLAIILSIAFASCQCAAAADHVLSVDLAMEECHDAPAIEAMSDDCCEQDATTTTIETAKKLGNLDSIFTNSSFETRLSYVRQDAVGIERRRGPPRPTTPIAMCDCLRL